MSRKKVSVQIGPFQKTDAKRALINISVGTFLPGHRFKDNSPEGIRKAILTSLISFALAVILYLIICSLK